MESVVICSIAELGPLLALRIFYLYLCVQLGRSLDMETVRASGFAVCVSVCLSLSVSWMSVSCCGFCRCCNL